MSVKVCALVVNGLVSAGTTCGGAAADGEAVQAEHGGACLGAG